jgi:hypothetical protein
MIAWALHRLAVVVEDPRQAEQEAPSTPRERTKIGPEVTA